MIAGTHRDPDGLKRLLHLARMNWLGHQYRRIGVECLVAIAAQGVDDVRARNHTERDALAVAHDDKRRVRVGKDRGNVLDRMLQGRVLPGVAARPRVCVAQGSWDIPDDPGRDRID